MALTIEAPHLEQRLRKLAEQHKMTTEDYVVHLLEQNLAPTRAPGSVPDKLGGAPPSQECTREWLAAFNAWIECHPRREPLPDHAFDRASFYDEAS
jgi:hypothetical protein